MITGQVRTYTPPRRMPKTPAGQGGISDRMCYNGQQ